MARQTDLYARWSREMRRGGFFRPGERVGVAVSGGPDSVLLLDLMREFGRSEGLTLAVVHFNHHLRGEESDEDERFVRNRAEELGLEFFRGESDVAKTARDEHANLEATARELRYRFFFSLIHQRRLDKISTAHTANDQAETVLLKILRGTGTRGLAGVHPVLDGKIVRPILNLTRAEVEAELSKRKLESRLDRTNLDASLRRNKLRQDLVPWLEREFNPEVVRLLKELSDRARDDEEVMEELARERASPWRVREGREEKIPIRTLAEFPAAVARRVLRQMILSAQGHLRGGTHRQIEALRLFARDAQSGRKLALPHNLAARKEFDWLILGPEIPPPKASGFSYPVRVPGEVSVPALGVTFRFKIIGQKEFQQEYNYSDQGALDPQKLTGQLTLRSWREGDRFQPLGNQKPRKLKELFRERKIPAGERRLWPVLESVDEVVWVRGMPPAAQAAAQPDAPDVMIIRETSGRGNHR